MSNLKFTIYTDGGARNNPGPAGAGFVILNSQNEILKEGSEYLGEKTNNWAEYEAVYLSLQALKKIVGEKETRKCSIEIKMESQLAVLQLSGMYQIKKENLFSQFIKIWNMRVKYFPEIIFTHIPREKNKEADKLANKAMDENN